MTTTSVDDRWAGTQRYQRPWYWYDWANSAFVTTVGTVLFGPYLTNVATEAACPGLDSETTCTGTLYAVPAAASLPSWVWVVALLATIVFTALTVQRFRADIKAGGIPGASGKAAAAAAAVSLLTFVGIAPLDPGSIASYTTTFATIVSALVLLVVGAIADRSAQPARLLGGFAWTGAVAACLLFFVAGSNWRLGAFLMIVATLCLGASLVVYDAILIRIARPDDRDKVSSRGWALGYLGGGLLLAINLVIVSKPDLIGVDTGMAVRISLLSAGLWWGVFTLIPVIGLWNLRGAGASQTGELPAPSPAAKGLVDQSVSQLLRTFADLKHYPQTLMFLAAYLFFNDGIQTVIASSSIYGSEQLGFAQSQLIALILMVQFVAFGGALLFGRLAGRFGAWRTILASLVIWAGIVIAAFFLPAKAFMPFVVLGVLIGIVLGGSQALSRSLFSQLVPRSREAEFFAFYQAMERGTSWFGTFVFGLVHQLTHSYRPAIVALVIFFVLGFVLLRKVDVRQGIRDAGNEVPAVV